MKWQFLSFDKMNKMVTFHWQFHSIVFLFILVYIKTFCLSLLRFSFWFNFHCMSGKINPTCCFVVVPAGGVAERLSRGVGSPVSGEVSDLWAISRFSMWPGGIGSCRRLRKQNSALEPGPDSRLHRRVRQPDEILQVVFIGTQARLFGRSGSLWFAHIVNALNKFPPDGELQSELPVTARRASLEIGCKIEPSGGVWREKGECWRQKGSDGRVKESRHFNNRNHQEQK